MFAVEAVAGCHLLSLKLPLKSNLKNPKRPVLLPVAAAPSLVFLGVESFCVTVPSSALLPSCCRSGLGGVVPYQGLLFLSESESPAVSSSHLPSGFTVHSPEVFHVIFKLTCVSPCLRKKVSTLWKTTYQ